LLVAPCLPQWISLTFAWDDNDELDEQALTFCVSGAIYARNTCVVDVQMAHVRPFSTFKL
jgi:hypothetical protein